MNLRDKANRLPHTPGVYLMKDSSGGILYVGKSKNLKARVSSYFQSSGNHTPKTEKLVKHLKDFDYILTDTELEALLLECKLIKELKPMYNRLLKRHEAYTYITVQTEADRRQITTAAAMNEADGALYFGPFSNKNRVDAVLQGLKRFLSIDCSSYTGNSPCLNYSLGYCLGHCFQKDKLSDYNRRVERIIALFRETDDSIVSEMEETMKKDAVECDFEKAAAIRDTLEPLKTMLKKEQVVQFTKENRNIVALEALNEKTIKLFFIKRNQILLTKKFDVSAKNKGEIIEEIAADAIENFGQNLRQPDVVRKEEIDQSQIIYSYLKNQSCSYAFLTNSLMKNEKRKDLKRTLTQLLQRELTRMNKIAEK